MILLSSYILLVCPVLLYSAEIMEIGENVKYKPVISSNEERINSTEESFPVTHLFGKSGWKIERPAEKISGGDDYSPYKYPFIAIIARILSAPEPFCGGSIITTIHVLTAAHCIPTQKNTSQIFVYAGVYDLRDLSSAVCRSVKQLVPHENYSPNTHLNDIGIVVLSAPFEYNTHIGPVFLPTQSLVIATGETVKILGWGSQSEKGQMTSKPKEMDASVVGIVTCSTAWQGSVVIPTTRPTQICSLNQTASPCRGDSGGPVIWHDASTSQYVLVGVVSFGHRCLEDKPSVNTKVQSYIPWILQKMSDDHIQNAVSTLKTRLLEQPTL